MSSGSTTTTTLPKQMKGLLVEQFNKSPSSPYAYKEDLPLPRVGPKDVLIRICAAGYCHTEAMVAAGAFESKMRGTLPLIPSHEPAGVVVALGEEAAKQSKVPVDPLKPDGEKRPLKEGDRVAALAFKDFCGKCSDCLVGDYKFCEAQDMCGVTFDGAFAEYMAADYRSVVVLPDALSYEAACPLACAGTTIYTALVHGQGQGKKLEKGQRVAILGGGALGHIGVQVAKALGLEVLLVDAREPPLELCRGLNLAPSKTYNSGKLDVKDKGKVKEAVEKECGGQYDVTIVTTDAIPAFTLALALTKKHGTMVVVGQPDPPIPIDFDSLIFRDVTVKGSLLGNAHDFQALCALVVEHGIEVKTRSYDLHSVDAMIADTHKDSHAGKLVVRIAQD